MAATFGFIGCGNMGGALAKAVARAGFGKEILLADVNMDKAESLAEEISACPSDALTIARECKFIFIGVKPQVIGDCFESIKSVLDSRKDKPVIISMAAGVAVSKVKDMSGIDSVIRIMPNMPVSVGSGVVLSCAEGITDEQKASFEKAMSQAGILDWLDEEFFDIASAVSGCGPAFVYMFAQALADGAVMSGLHREKALLYAAGTLEGAAKMILESGKHPEELKDNVCSPNGSTIVGVKALEDGRLRGVVMNAVRASYIRTKELGK